MELPFGHTPDAAMAMSMSYCKYCILFRNRKHKTEAIAYSYVLLIKLGGKCSKSVRLGHQKFTDCRYKWDHNSMTPCSSVFWGSVPSLPSCLLPLSKHTTLMSIWLLLKRPEPADHWNTCLSHGVINNFNFATRLYILIPNNNCACIYNFRLWSVIVTQHDRFIHNVFP